MTEKKLVPAEIYSRVVGYFRPVEQWNKGKQQEFKDRIMYNVPIMDGLHGSMELRKMLRGM